MRALAVLSVLGYHLSLSWLPGGFLGVDVFFVLSGYLITTLLVSEHAATGRIDLPQFWTRRARRLAPALLLMAVAVMVGVRVLRPVTEWSSRASDLVWTLFYGANWHQVLTSQDYFAQWGGVSPLRHMWSIAIEEQFYVVWPLLIALGLRPSFRRYVLPAIIVAAGLSALATALIYTPGNPTRAYVGTDTRAHELLIGAALALLMRRARSGPPVSASMRLALGAASTVALLTAIVTLSDASPLYYRGGSLALSIAAATLLWSIETAPASALARVFSLGPIPWIGRVSYGLYLWHWPAILFTPTLLVMALGGAGLAIAQNGPLLDVLRVVVAVVCTVLSYYLVEQPIRHGRFAKRLPPLRVAVVAATAFVAVFYGVRTTLAVPPELLKQVQQSAQQGNACEQKMDSQKVEIPTCVVVDGGPGRPVLAVMGDSVAKSMTPAFARIAQAHGWTFMTGAHNHCTVAPRKMGGTGWASCENAIPIIQREVLARHPALIVISDNWLPIDSHDDGGVLRARNSPEHIADIEARMAKLLTELTASGSMVVLMRYTPESAPIECADPRLQVGDRCRVPAVHPRFVHYNEMLDRLGERFPDRVRVIDVTSAVCPSGQCDAKVDGLILRYDTLHYSEDGSRWLSPILERQLIAAGIKLDL